MTIGCVFTCLFAASVTFSGVSGGGMTKQAFSEASFDFALELLKTQIAGTEGNVILSPSSVGILLAILQQGAKASTLEEINSVLHMTADQSRHHYHKALKALEGVKKNVTLEWGNRAYVRPDFEILEKFNSTIMEKFEADIQELDFVDPSPEEAASAMNDWVKEITHDNIKNLVSPAALTADTVLVLLNAIYFKGLWDVPFSKVLSRSEYFETSPDNSKEAMFMRQKETFIAGEDPDSGLLWVDLDYKDPQFSMLFLLPEERHGLAEVLEKLNGELLLEIINERRTRQTFLSIPKFKLEEKVSLAKPLKELGLSSIFTSHANLQGISSNDSLSVSQIIHQANVEIDEDGTTASAGSGFYLDLASFPNVNTPLTFKADHPFLFFILDKRNKLPLFAGRIVDPS